MKTPIAPDKNKIEIEDDSERSFFVDCYSQHPILKITLIFIFQAVNLGE
jgi:hypothetical protein